MERDKTIIATFKTADCIKSKALFLLINAHVDHFYKALIKRDGVYGKGDQAHLLLQAQCDNLTAQDCNHYNQLFVGLQIKGNESVMWFLHWFTLSDS